MGFGGARGKEGDDFNIRVFLKSTHSKETSFDPWIRLLKTYKRKGNGKYRKICAWNKSFSNISLFRDLNLHLLTY